MGERTLLNFWSVLYTSFPKVLQSVVRSFLSLEIVYPLFTSLGTLMELNDGPFKGLVSRPSSWGSRGTERETQLLRPNSQIPPLSPISKSCFMTSSLWVCHSMDLRTSPKISSESTQSWSCRYTPSMGFVLLLMTLSNLPCQGFQCGPVPIENRGVRSYLFRVLRTRNHFINLPKTELLLYFNRDLIYDETMVYSFDFSFRVLLV